MNDLLLHPHTRKDAERIIARPPQALLIIGKNGSGTSLLARKLAETILGTTKLENHPYFQYIGTSEPSISIEVVRDLQRFFKLKVAGDQKDGNRIVIIENAGRMSTEAQNALLKTLEEPPAGSMIILTTQSVDELLPTISSRTQSLQVLPVSEDDAWEYFQSKGIKQSDFKKAYALSAGGVELLSSLLEDGEHELIDMVSLAKEILAEESGKRLLRTEGLAKDKDKIRPLLDGLYRICHAGLHASALKNAENATRQWKNREQHVLTAMSAQQKNANTKLLLDALFLAL